MQKIKTQWDSSKKAIIAVIVVTVVVCASISAWFLWFRDYVGRPHTQAVYTMQRTPHTWVETPLKGKMKAFNVNKNQFIQQNEQGKNEYCFKFVPGAKNGAVPTPPKHTMKAILAFGDAKSRNFLMQNDSQIAMAVKSAYMNVEFCMLQTTNEYSVLAVEALAEVDYNRPDATFEVLKALMYQNTSELKTRDARLQLILEVLRRLGVTKTNGKPEISETSIKNGSFYQFGYMMSEIQRAQYVPAILVDGQAKNRDLSIYNPDDMWKYMKALPRLSHV